MRTRSLRALLLAIGATLALTGMAAAGGYATATLDGPPDNPEAGESVQIGFTLLQHGVTPVTYGPTSLDVIDAATGDRTTFAARPSGPAGHWVAEVIFPGDSVYRFEINHDLQIQSINVRETAVSVGAGSGGGPADAVASTPVPAASIVPWFVLGGAVMLIGAVLLLVLRPLPRDASVVAAAPTEAGTSTS